MECSCNASGIAEDYDPVEVLDSRNREARVVHGCSECSNEIQPGATYFYTKYKYAGRVSVHKRCSICGELLGCFFPCGFGFGALMQDLWSYVREVEGEVLGCAEFKKLSFEAKCVVFAMIEKYWDENPEDE